MNEYVLIFSQGGSETSDSSDPFGWDFDQIDSDVGGGDEAPTFVTTQSSKDADPFGEDNGGSGGADDGGSGSWFGSGEDDDDDTWEDDDDDFFG